MSWQSEQHRLNDYMKAAFELPQNLFRWRMKGPCFYCGKETIRCGSLTNPDNKYTRDHVRPRVKTKKGVPRITVTACYKCNQLKGTDNPFFFVKKHLPHRANKIKWSSIGYKTPQSWRRENRENVVDYRLQGQSK